MTRKSSVTLRFNPLIAFFLLSFFFIGTAGWANKSSRTEYLRRMQKDVDDITKELHALDHHAAVVAVHEREDFKRQVRALWKKERLARVKLKQLRHASEGEWKKLRASEDSTVIHLRKSYRYVVNHFPNHDAD